MQNGCNRVFFVSLTLVLIAAFCVSGWAQSHITGTLPDGAAYVMDAPANWNGVLLLYSHGYNAGPSNPAYDVGDGSTGSYLLNAGYALAGSSYATTGWAVHEALPDQIATLDAFQSLFGAPVQTIAWGHSMGGIITAGLVQQYPDRFSGALPMCGVTAGGVGFFNSMLDAAFTFNTLIAGGSLQVANISDPLTNYQNAESWLGYAEGTPQGQARIAFAAAMFDVPGWFDPATKEPAATDYATRQANQFYWMAYDVFPFAFYYRSELEARAGGNPSWNTSVNYARQLQRSANNAAVQALYKTAGLSLNADLNTLKNAVRIPANQSAKNYLIQNITFNGQLSVPVLALHTTGDGLVPPEDEQAYAATAHKAGNQALVRDVFVHRAGHCVFTPAETVTALKALTTRMATGKWKGLSPSALDNNAVLLGPNMNFLWLNNQYVYTSPEYDAYQSPVFLRPFDAFTQ